MLITLASYFVLSFILIRRFDSFAENTMDGFNLKKVRLYFFTIILYIPD